LSTHGFGPNFLPRLGVPIGAALLLHAVILGGADWLWPSTAPPPLPTAALQVRVVAPAPPVATQARAVVAVPPPVAPVAARVKPVPPPIAVARTAAVTVERRTAVVAAAPVAAPADDAAIPLYRTRLPPAATLRYELSRGPLRGTGELVWRPQGDRYELRLEARLDGLTILAQTSTGALDAAGIAPLRFTDQRPRRGTLAANFQREAGKISYSGSASEFAVQPGAQDRLSWMLQLAAIVSAEPQLALAGAKVVMQVTGARGDAGVWVFRCLGPEALDTRGGATDALKFVREPREAYDTTVQVWLDAKPPHFPLRATQNTGGSDVGYELRLVEASVPN